MPNTPSGITYPAAGTVVDANSLEVLAKSVEKVLGQRLRTYFCSLKTQAATTQPIPPSTWTPVRFDLENKDSDGWHTTRTLTDHRSAVITPTVNKVGLLAAMAQFKSGTQDASQISVQFARDPFGPAPDTTATQDFSINPGAQYRVSVWPIIVHAGQSLGFRVFHNATQPINLDLAEFKVWCPPGSDLTGASGEF